MLLSRGAERRIVAEATTRGDTVVVQLQDLTADQLALPESVVQYVARTHEYVILDDALAHNQFSSDPYISEQHAALNSVLAIAQSRQAHRGALPGKQPGAPRLHSGPDSRAEIACIASCDLVGERASLSRSRRARNENPTSRRREHHRNIRLESSQGQVIEANEAFLRLLGYDRDDLVSGRIRWTDLTPNEWRVDDERAMQPN